MSEHSDSAGGAAGKGGRGRRAAERPADQAVSAAIARAVERRAPEVVVRRVPRQARGAATFNAILDATAHLLEEAGPEVLTTNLVAELAGVNIATLYQYFPSKESILLALFQRDVDARIRASDEMLRGLGDNDDWRTQLADAIDRNVAMRRTQPGGGPLRRAMRASIDLQDYDRKAVLGYARALAVELAKRGHADQAQAELAALCVSEVATALLDLWALGYAGVMGYQDDRIIAEYKKIVIS
jgi:AcrR family transcriptional regulator